MVRVLLTALVMGAFGMALAGCHAEAGGGVGGNSASSMTLPR